MNFTSTLGLASAALLLTTTISAQVPLRGDVDGIQGTNRFQLDCTNIELISGTVNLQQLENISRQNNIEFEFQVTVASVSPMILNVLSAQQIPETFEMGNLRLGETDSWEVRGTPGSMAWVLVGDRVTTGYFPIPGWGTLVLGPPFAVLNTGTIDPTGQFRFNFMMPNEPAFLGVEISSQAIVRAPSGAVTITHPDCKEIEN